MVITILAFLFFLYHRSQQYSGDGFLIARITEGGKWFVKNEMLSQALIQFGYTLAAPLHWSPMEVMNVISCLSGALALFILLRMYRSLGYVNPGWGVLLFGSSGFLIYACGHTEYYPMVLPAMLLYGYLGYRYLNHEVRLIYVTVVFVLAVSLHFGMLMALPSLLLLPVLRRRYGDYREIVIGGLLMLPLVLMRDYPSVVGFRAASLSPSINFLPWFYEEDMYRYYAFFQWDHVWDWFYAWTMRSWVFWPTILGVFWLEGWRKFLLSHNLFFLLYVLPFTFWSTVWHPDLGMQEDWDLFALEAVPCLLWVMVLLPKIRLYPWIRTLFFIALVSSALMMYAHVRESMNPPRKGFGKARITVEPLESSYLKVNGFYREGDLPRLREGVYEGKLIHLDLENVYDFYFHVLSGEETRFTLQVETGE